MKKIKCYLCKKFIKLKDFGGIGKVGLFHTTCYYKMYWYEEYQKEAKKPAIPYL